MLFTLNFYIRKYWVFVVDTLLRAVVRHRTMMRIASFAVIALIVIFLFMFTSLADLLIAGVRGGILRFLALVLGTTMLIIYYIGSQSLKEVVIAKRIHLFVFIILSLFTFTGVMTVAQNGYATYEEAINIAFVTPLVTNIEGDYERRIEDRLLEIFREDVKKGGCDYFDYADKTGAGLTQFVFIERDPAFVELDAETRAVGEPLAGRSCIHETKFLLTPEGKWYQVLEQEFF